MPEVSRRVVGLSIDVIFALFASGSAVGATMVNVKQFGAVGDGQTDDRPAIQAAMNFARQQGSATVYFDPGVYLLSSSTSANGQLAEPEWNSNQAYSMNLIGNGAILRSGVVGSAILLVEGYWQNSTIQGLTFENTHGLTAATTAAIAFSGGGANAIQDWRVAGNTFRNFSRHIAVSGVNSLDISDNQFFMTNGRDSGTGANPEPNVGIWLFNNGSNGGSINITVQRNYYDGCSGGDVSYSLSHRCGDGAVYGQGSNVRVTDNYLKGFSFEGVYLFRDDRGGPGPAILNNHVDASIVKGDISGGGQWGIRCDADNTTILHNTVVNAQNGIFVYGIDLSQNIRNVMIANNTVSTTPDSTQAFASGIYVAGASSVYVNSNTVSISGQPIPLNNAANAIYLSGLYGGGSRGMDTVGVKGNSITFRQYPAFGATTGIFLQWATNWNISQNWISGLSMGIETFNMNPYSAQVVQFAAQNTLVGNGTNVTVANGYVQ
jgi:hypothetical protein